MADPEDTPVKRGTIVVLTAGSYSDYQILLVARVRRQYFESREREIYLAANPSQRERYSFKEHQYAAWLTSKEGPLNEIGYDEENVDP